MADYIAIDVANATRQIEHMLVAYPELVDDDDLRADMLEGETDLTRLMSKLVRIRQERLASVEGLSGYIGDLGERKARLQRGADGIKTLMLSLMSAADLPKLVLDEATISVTKPRESVVIHNVADLPQGYVQHIPTPDKKAIGDALKAGESIPGAALELGDVGLTVRVK